MIRLLHPGDHVSTDHAQDEDGYEKCGRMVQFQLSFSIGF